MAAVANYADTTAGDHVNELQTGAPSLELPTETVIQNSATNNLARTDQDGGHVKNIEGSSISGGNAEDYSPKDKPDDAIHMITPTQQMLSSTIGALTTSIIVTPLDVVKIRLQAQQKSFHKNKCFLYCNGLMEHLCYCVNGNGTGHIHQADGKTITVDPRDIKWYQRPIPGHFTGTLDAIIKISRSEGIRSLWSGLPPTLLMAIPATVIYFTAYDRLRANLWSWCKCEQQPMWIPMVCGATARCIAATIISPLEMVRTKMQSKKLSYWEVATAIRHSVRLEGSLSLWRGLGPTLLRDVPFSSIYWGGYEYMKQKFDQRHPTFQFSLTAGAAAGAIAAVATLPFDVAKTHRQIELGERDLVQPRWRGRQRAPSTRDILRGVYKQSGVSGLFSGIVPRVIKVAPSCAIMITCYEFGKQFFVNYNRKRASES